MIRGKIQGELTKLKWSTLKLSEESQVRYATITEYLAGKQEINTKNLEKICATLGLKLQPSGGSKFYDYDRLIKSFNGDKLINCDTDFDIQECEFAHYLCGVLVRSASNHWVNEIGHHSSVTWGNVYQNFVSEEWVNGKKLIDIPGTLSKRELVRMAELYFNEKERLAMAYLLTYEYPQDCKREHMVAPFMSGTFRNYQIVPKSEGGEEKRKEKD